MAGILHCLEPDHIRRGRQGMPTHFLSQDGNTPKQFCGTIPPTDKTLCCPVSHLFLFWQKLTCGLLYLSTQACSPFCLFGTLPFPTQPLFFLRCQKYTYIKLWNLRIWRYFLTLQGCICTLPCYLLLYYYSYSINILTTWYPMPFPYK